MSQADWAIWLYDNKMFLVEFQFNFQPNWYNNLQSSSLIPQKIYGMKMHIFQKPTCQLLIIKVIRSVLTLWKGCENVGNDDHSQY